MVEENFGIHGSEIPKVQECRILMHGCDYDFSKEICEVCDQPMSGNIQAEPIRGDVASLN